MTYRLFRHSVILRATRVCHVACLVLGALLLASCSTKVNTAGSRFWQSFTARYNIYYNGHNAYKEGLQAQEKGIKDNYTERLPIFAESIEQNAGLGKGNFTTCIEKMQKAVTLRSIKKRPTHNQGKKLSAKEKLYMQRKEFNPFLKHCWMEMGKAQFHTGNFEEAGATFSYITRLYAAEPLVVAEARSWLARCYAQSGWLYDAEDILARQKRDSLPKRLLPERDATMADLLLRQEKIEEALPYLRSAIKHCKSKVQKARLYFIQAQVERALGHDAEAYRALGKCIGQSPAYEFQFSARIMQTEVLGQDAKKAKSMVSRLKRMARSSNNKDYLDQVYYAMGNILLAQNDTAAAIGAYEKGRKLATRGGIEKGVLLLRLAEIYWEQRRFDKAQPCYSECISLLGKEHTKYQEVMKRSKVLDELVPYTSAVQLQDSLQWLAKLSEPERLAAIDRVIEALKKKEAEERKARRDSAAKARADANAQQYGGLDNTPEAPAMPVTDKSWYFYNPQLVSRGKQDFRRQWGNRKNEDDWRRMNHTVVAMDDGQETEYDDGQQTADDGQETAETDSVANDSIAEVDSIANDPHKREYYLAQIPFTEEQVAASNDIIMDGLYNAGVIEKDKLEDFPLASTTLERLVTQYEECSQMEDALYQLFLLYSRWGKPAEADRYRAMLATRYPEGAMTRMITDPDFELYARYGLQIEDSLYTETYQAYLNRQDAVVNRNYEVSSRRFPNGLNRPKFIFVHALNNLGRVPSDSIISELRTLLKEFPKADVAEMAGMIVKGLESGRTVADAHYDLGSLWSRRAADTEEAAAELKGRTLQPDRNVPFAFLLAYPTDSLPDDRLLYEVARFNFTSFKVRGFELSFEKNKVLTQFRVAGFNSYDEAHSYTQKIYSEALLHDMLKKGRIIVISEQNLPLLGTVVSYDEYQKYFEEHYTPLELPENIRTLLEEPNVTTIYEDEVTTVNGQQSTDDGQQTEEDGYIDDSSNDVPVEETTDEGQQTEEDGESFPAEDEYPAE